MFTRCSLIGSSGPDHAWGLSKGFLRYLAKLCDTAKTDRQLFSEYMVQFVQVGMDLNLSAFARWKGGQREFITALYGTDCKKEPHNFSLKNHYDVGRISELLKVNIVIYCGPDPTSSVGSNIFHQYSDMVPPSLAERQTTVSFFISYSGRLYAVSPTSTFQKALSDSVVEQMWSLRQFLPTVCPLASVGLGRALSELLQLQLSEEDEEILNQIRSISQLVFCENSRVAPILSSLARPLVVAVYTRRGSLCGVRVAEKKGMFSKAVFEIVHTSESLRHNSSSRRRLPPLEDLEVVMSIGGTNRLLVPPKKWKEKIYRRLFVVPAEDKFDTSYIFSGMAPGPDFDEKERERRKKRAESRRKKYGRPEPKKSVPRKFENCTCTICRQSDVDYEFNMDKRGPEKLLTVEFSCKDLLGLLGIDSPANLQVVARMVELSIAAFDIESKTVELNTEQPDEELFSSIDSQMSVEGHMKKVQRPIMVAHLDSLDGSGDPETWTVKDDDETSCFNMMKAYFKSVRRRRDRASVVKSRICSSLLDTLRDRRKRLENYLREEAGENEEVDKREKRITASARISLYGRLEKKLLDLCSLYVVFSFYGSGYDHVLLMGYLSPIWYEQKMRPRIERRGNKVVSINLKGNLTFRDITKMLAPGTNLRNFGKLFGLEQQKAHFPFSILTSVEALKREGLPDDEEAWKSDLGGAPASREEIEEAMQLYDRAGCKNLGDYLRTYLKLDVVVLFKSVQLWRKSLLETVGVDFVESKKFTISSMSNYAGTLCQAERLRVGSFFPNNRRHYGLLKRGMRG